MKAVSGAARQVLFGFFASHIVFTLIIDLQALLPGGYFPAICRQLLDYHIATFRDPLMRDARENQNDHSLLWFQSLVAIGEMLVQMPYFSCACYFFFPVGGADQPSQYPDWFRSYSIIYATHTATTMIPILSYLLLVPYDSSTPAETLPVVVFVYLPYLLVPLWILFMAVGSSPSPRLKTA
jgi:EXPERA (EXPanded EBP superfamily)